MLAADLLERRKMQFTLWRPNGNQNAPKLVIGTFQAGNPNVVANRLELPLATSAATPGLWSLAARATGLADGHSNTRYCRRCRSFWSRPAAGPSACAE
jgi:hypothetical protein